MKRILVLLALSACSTLPRAMDLDDPPGLAELAAQGGRLFGVSVLAEPLASDPSYQSLLAQQFSLVTPENAMKMGVLRPEKGGQDYAAADAIVEFAEDNELEVRGHPVVWHRQLPEWLKRESWEAEELREVLQSHVQQTVSRYAGKIYAWDVINEAVNSDGSFRKSIWYTHLGTSYLTDAFYWAHSADPNALLFYNDYDIAMPNEKMVAVHALLKTLRANGVPVHGVGLQMHIRPNFLPSGADVEYVISRFAELGLEVHISELDIALALPADERARKVQADYYAEILQACLSHPACTSFGLWGLSDAHSWVPSHFKGLGDATVFDRELQPKAPYDALRQELQEQPQR